MFRFVLLGPVLSLAACDSRSPPQALPADVAAGLDGLLLDEYHAEAVYARVLADFGDERPFSNVVQAEQTHAASLETLCDRYGLDLPANPHSAESVAGFVSIGAACAAGVEAEIANAALYDAVLDLSVPDDVRLVVTANRDASLLHHLPAFERCATS